MPDLLLIPHPQKITRGRGSFILPAAGQIAMDDKSDLFSARQLQQALPPAVKTNFRIVRGGGANTSPIALRRGDAISHDQGYSLLITRDGIALESSTSAGMFYAVATLAQLLRQFGRKLPIVTIEDWPDFVRRGVYHDVSRGKVPKLKTLLQLVDDLAALKINEIQLYVENVYAFKRHPAIYDDTTPLTAGDLRAIDKACRRQFIDFVPSLTSLGHFDKILRRPAYRHLAEAEPAELKKAGIKTWSTDPWSLCVTDPGSKRLLAEMYDEFLPHFSSKYFNICCDESWDLGKGRSKPRADKIGAGKLYVDWVRFCHRLAAKHGRKIQLWGDIILRHPELIPSLPKDATLLEWGYEADHPFAEHCELFARSGRKFYVAPGTSTWQTFAGRTANAFANMRSAAQAGLRHGAAGFLNTDWGDHGHQQFLSISLLPFAFGAAVSWNEKGSMDQGVIAAAGAHVFRQIGTDFSTAVSDLGQTYQRVGVPRSNGSVDWFLFREAWNELDYLNRVKPRDLQSTIATTRTLLGKLQKGRLQHPEGELIIAEMVLTARTIIYAAQRALARQAIQQKSRKIPQKFLRRLISDNAVIAREFRRLWLARNRSSRLADVLYHLKRQEVEFSTTVQ